MVYLGSYELAGLVRQRPVPEVCFFTILFYFCPVSHHLQVEISLAYY